MADYRAGGVRRSPIAVAALMGLIAGVPMGVLLHLGTDLMPLLGGILGTESALVGWVLHLVTATVFGALFGWLVMLPIFRTLTDTLGECILLGVVHSYALMIVMAGVALPAMVEILALSGEGVPLVSVPGPSAESLLPAGVFAFAHLIYGAILGAGYGVLENVEAEPDARGPDGEASGSSSR